MLAIALYLAFTPYIPVKAMSSCTMMPNCDMTLDALPSCITHHWNNGDILSEGVYKSLMAKANVAIAARDKGQTGAAIDILNAFINQVNALRSAKIKDMAADCLVMHAMASIDLLQ